MLNIWRGKCISVNTLCLSKSGSAYPSAWIKLPHQWGRFEPFYWLTMLPVLTLYGGYN